ncbi:MAG: PQQ-binding-like beta-propeller repeat protein [Gammaproteobacteria bacterium]|nr:PQQ-binding-like beta-propeller repeat protein [Gammaproteobacteria bacterium]
MFASAKKTFVQLFSAFCVLLLLSACASRGGADTAPVATAEELGIPESESAEVEAAEVVAEPEPEPEKESGAVEYPTLFSKPYLVKGNGDHQLKSLWTAQIDGDGQFLMHFRPAIDGEQACAAGRGAVYCFDRNSGERLWKRKVRDLASGVSFSSEFVIVGTDEGEAIALSRVDGSEQWRAAIGGEVLALAAVGRAQVGEVVVAYTSAGNLTGLRARDGETIWVQEQKVPRLTLRGLSTPLAVDGLVVSGHDNGRMTVNKLLDGTGVWADELVSPTGRNELERLADIDGAIAHYRGDVFASSWGGKLGAWSLKRGRALWQADIASVTGVAADLRRVYVTDTDNALHALDSRSGRILWKRDDLVAEEDEGDRRVVATTSAMGAPLVLDNLGRLYFYERATGDLDFAKSITGEYATAPAVEEDQILTLSRGGLLSMWQLLEVE